MTTIAYKEGVVAWDSLIISNGIVIDEDFDKSMTTDDGAKLIFTGTTADFQSLFDAYCGSNIKQKLECYALVVEEERLYKIGCDEDGLWKSPIRSDSTFALGSGNESAYTAMDMGATARGAVEMAAKRDTYTGGRVREYPVLYEAEFRQKKALDACIEESEARCNEKCDSCIDKTGPGRLSKVIEDIGKQRENPFVIVLGMPRERRRRPSTKSRSRRRWQVS